MLCISYCVFGAGFQGFGARPSFPCGGGVLLTVCMEASCQILLQTINASLALLTLTRLLWDFTWNDKRGAKLNLVVSCDRPFGSELGLWGIQFSSVEQKLFSVGSTQVESFLPVNMVFHETV